ncbi:amino acid--tRNA ligase-related protein [Plantactinospora alkalitolerans]|uniref:amino acid--tRNA ligase-related protein n=1 Tax=Plantactinospora alkalitolerans TaxID=2789879 RepID=UPI002B1F3D1C|nr:amino acid--tRNA ligase-related protein [Plantactinospora alkalitolerans]
MSSPMGLGSDSLPVAVDMFGVRTYLADSMQFGLEYLCRFAPAGAYYVMPSFRGESTDRTHLAQFMHAEAELPGDLDNVLTVVEAYLRYLAQALASTCSATISRITGDLDHLNRLLHDARPFRRLTFDEAADLLGHDPRWIVRHGGWRSLTREGEQELMARCGQFLWVTHYDHLAVPFYQAQDEHGRAVNADLLFGPGEVVGAGQRHTNRDQVLAALRLHQVDSEAYDWYVRMKETVPLETAGFGLGVERFFMWLLRHDDIRDMQLLPRENGKAINP